MKFNILVVDDEKNIRIGLCQSLEMDGYNVLIAADGVEALKIFEENVIELIITDLKMPNLSGEELLKRVISENPNIPVIILTGHGTIESAVNAMREGAYDFLTKPVNLDRLSLLVKRALSTRELILSHKALQEELQKKNQFSNIIGKSSKMKKIFELVKLVAPTKASVLITGQSGVGKELIVDAIHFNSPRCEKAFIKVHCAALTETLLESELFGHEKGSFTGATMRKRGRFELAHNGTLFLDEIGEINQNVQIKILRVLQERTFERVGGEETIDGDVRIIAATNRDLKSEIEKGNFREDLYYRLNVVNIALPLLSERREDIPLLVSSFIKELSRENDKNVNGIDSKATKALYAYSWPGNVRELRNCIESSIVMCKTNIISLDDLPPYIQSNSDKDFIRLSFGTSLSEVEKAIIIFNLSKNNGNKSKTAEMLGIGRKTLHRKIKEYNIDI